MIEISALDEITPVSSALGFPSAFLCLHLRRLVFSLPLSLGDLNPKLLQWDSEMIKSPWFISLVTSRAPQRGFGTQHDSVHC